MVLDCSTIHYLLKWGSTQLNGNVLELAVPLGAEVADDIWVLVWLPQQLDFPVCKAEAFWENSLHCHWTVIKLTPCGETMEIQCCAISSVFYSQTSWIIVYWLFRLTCRRLCPRHHDQGPLLDGKLCCPLWQYLSLPLINQTHHFNNENSWNYYPSVEQAPTKSVNVISIPNSLPPSSCSLAELPSSDTDRLEWLEARGVTLGLLWSEHSERVRATSR